MPLVVYILFIFLCFHSCMSDGTSKSLTQIENSNIDQIMLPSDIIFTIQSDTVDFDINDCDFKIIYYVDSIGCSACRLNLIEWERIIGEFNIDPEVTVKLLIMVQSDDIENVKNTTKKYRFNYPLVVDNSGFMDSINKKMNKLGTNTLLLNDNNEVLLAGNPIDDIVLKQQYKSVMRIQDVQYENQNDIAISVKPKFLSMGVFNVSEKKHSKFILENRSDSCIIISDIISSCNCINAWTTSDTIIPHGILPVFITCEPDSSDYYFRRYITINFQGYYPYINLLISGFVKHSDI